MNCPKCGKEATHDMRFGHIDYYICEYCHHKFGYIDDGQASSKEIADLQRSFQEQYEKNVRGIEPHKRVLARMGVMVMHDPRERRRPGHVKKLYNPDVEG